MRVVQLVRRIACAAALLMLGAGQARAEPVMVSSFGIGTGSCANWTQNPHSVVDGYAWVAGFWTGLNDFNATNHRVGETSDANGIVAEVRLACEAEPSKSMIQTEIDVYTRLQRENR